MLELDSPRWGELRHAYGPATDTPQLLRQLASLPDAIGDSQPWFELWSSLAHQGDVYSASFAAVPHVVEVLATHPQGAPAVFFLFPAWVDICRHNTGATVPHDLEPAYASALARLPSLAAADRPWSADTLRCILAAIAVAKGQPVVAEVILELSHSAAEQVREWMRDNL